MESTQLDNPVWHALNGRHRHLAEVCGVVRRYPAACAPFIAVPAADVPLDDEVLRRGEGAAGAYFLGVLPQDLPAAWRFRSRSAVLQMVPPRQAALPDGAITVSELGPADHRAMLSLAQLAFPDFFRPRTCELGTYLGIFADGRLVAMAGERMAFDGFQEISGVCTHPDHLGRGHARRLTQALLQRHRGLGLESFLHVSEGNTAARRLYEAMGFSVRAALPMGQLETIV
ncbi:GNAT family N-acetyltransferase [Nevskia soli]|uniref:GNAT family N-acetyltransferase n=1 Tax=Nevskia soli TaxID=418856 RepID=UPI0004A76D56|nr:GNAT family N-acetyltransferase [Nevskia soli]